MSEQLSEAIKKPFEDPIDDDDDMYSGGAGSVDVSEGFIKTLLSVQNNVINLPGNAENFDIYLAKTLFPVLVPGLEQLSEEVERIMVDGKKID